MASRRRRRRARARVAQYQGNRGPRWHAPVLAWSIRTCAIEREYLGTAHAVLPESRTLGGPDLSRYRVDGFRYRYAVLTGWNADRVRSRRSGHSEIWVSNRDGSQANKLTSFAGGGRVGGWKPCWSADGKLIAFDTQGTATGNWNLYIVAADGGPRQTADVRRLQQRPAELVSRRPVDLLCIRSHRRLADLEDAIVRRDCRADDLGGGLDPVVSWDGQRVYYAKPPPIQGIWAVPAEGGQEVQIVSRGR